MVIPSIIVYSLLFVEASINLTYYTDCVFALVIAMIFFGMIWTNYKQKDIQFDAKKVEQ